jgi:DNA-directed DNA polymerase III PolC
MLDFVHLHVHSCCSFHEGTDFPAELASRAARLGFRALALTDTNGLYGAVPFVKAAREAGIEPILGVHLDGGRAAGPRAVVLGRGEEGYGALCRLVTARQLEWGEGEREPSAAAALHNLVSGLEKEASRIVVLASSPELLGTLSEILPRDVLYGELVYSGDPASAGRCRRVLEACRLLKRPAAATNAVRFADASDFEVHRVLRAIGERSTIWQVGRIAGPASFLKTAAQMESLFSHRPEALANTLRIAGECAVKLDLGNWKFPAIDLRRGETPFSSLWKRSFEGLKTRFHPLTKEAVERLRYELEVIDERGFAPYFLVVDDIARQAARWGMHTIGRGSAACSLVSYCLGITHVDPLALNLHFERFLNPERSSPPDIDLDFSWKDRDRILKYVYEKYGPDRVAMICTHVTFGARSAVREIGRAYGLSESELSKLTKPIPHYGVHALTRLAEEVPECRDLPVDREPYRTILSLGERVIGFPRHLSIHAGGIVISPIPITGLVPLERAAKGLVVTQYDMGPVEELGLVKIDLLSQRSLGVLSDAVEAVRERTGETPPVFDEERVLGDGPTRRLIREGRTIGCFYIESPAMRSLLRKLRTDTFEDLTAASSVIRPGVAESGMMQEYIRRHLEARALSPRLSSPEGGEGEQGCVPPHPSPSRLARGKGRGEGPWYLHPKLQEVLRETHGVMIYQEDVLRVAHTLAGMSLGEADSLRRSMSGKMRSAEAMARVRDRFLAGSAGRGVDAAVAGEVWRQVESFAGYAFCKAHSASYALLSFQVAWLKAHYPAEFMAAVLSNGGGFYGAAAYISEARRLGLLILLPDVNLSEEHCRGRGKELRLGLGTIGRLGSAGVDTLLESRRSEGPFTSLSSLLDRTALDRSEVEILIRCGACDGFELTRPEMLWRLACRTTPSPRRRGEGRGERPRSRSPDLFPNAGGLDALVPRLPEYSLEERCRIEEETFGFTVSRHPLDLLPPGLSRGMTPARDMAKKIGRRVRMLGRAIAFKRVPVGKKERREWMKFLSLEDMTGTFEAILFPKCYRRYARQTLTSGPYLLTGRVEEDHGVCSLNVERLEAVTGPAPGET